MAELKLSATQREDFGKGAARRARREGQIPAVLYGHGVSGVHLLLPGHETFLIVKDSANAVVSLTVGSKKYLALVKAIQRHPVRRNILHIDLLAVKAGEKVEVDIPLIIVGESAAGTGHTQEEFTLLVKAPATNIPESIEVSIEGLEDGAVVRVGDLDLPEGVECEVDAEQDIVSVATVRDQVIEDSGSAEGSAQDTEQE